MVDLASVLDRMTVRAELTEDLPGGSVRCLACAHRCKIGLGKRGVCQVRFNKDGQLRVPFGYVAALQADPIEKKPFSHLMPGATALTFGMLGCDFHCGYCQNWLTSQALRDHASDVSVNLVHTISPVEIITAARRAHAEIVVSSYNEPLITSEWAAAIFKEARAAGLLCAFVSNGNATVQALEYLSPYLSAYKIDLKSMQAKNYRSLGGILQNVLDTIQKAHAMGLWVEVVTLIVPGFNDSNEELFETARFLRSVSADIPWHVTAFHKDYKMTEPHNTPAATLLRAADIGREAGLNFVYAGNLPGRVEEYEDTRCSHCQRLLIRRFGYVVSEYHITAHGACPTCGAQVPGVWSENPKNVKLNGYGMPVSLV